MLDAVRSRSLPERPIPTETSMASSYRLELTTQALAAVALIGALKLGLLSTLLAGLLVYQLVHLLTPARDSALVPHRRGRSSLSRCLL
jgi:hypothetical protein